MTITLPYPPSVNTYYRSPNTGRLAGRHLISEEGRKYRRLVMASLRHLPRSGAFLGRLGLRIILFPPDKRRRDLDNAMKGLLDALQHAGVYQDDSQIDDLHILRGELVAGGQVSVTIEVLASAPSTWEDSEMGFHALGDR